MKARSHEPAGRAGAPDDSRVGDALSVLGGATRGPRRAIVEALVAVDRLQTPEQILAEARTLAPSTSLATVYRTLERLDGGGRLKRAVLASGAVGYTYCAGDHHDHAVCTQCGRVVRVDACPGTGWAAAAGFRVSSHELNFYGTCRACRTVDDGADSPS